MRPDAFHRDDPCGFQFLCLSNQSRPQRWQAPVSVESGVDLEVNGCGEALALLRNRFQLPGMRNSQGQIGAACSEKVVVG